MCAMGTMNEEEVVEFSLCHANDRRLKPEHDRLVVKFDGDAV